MSIPGGKVQILAKIRVGMVDSGWDTFWLPGWESELLNQIMSGFPSKTLVQKVGTVDTT